MKVARKAQYNWIEYSRPIRNEDALKILESKPLLKITALWDISMCRLVAVG
jgi:hypothetical protein